MSEPAVSVVVRAKNEAPAIARLLDILARQELGGRTSEVIVVDSGSTDGTPDIARKRGAQVIEIPPESFTYGGALNTGIAAARAPIVIALSAHAFPRSDDWLARMLEPFAGERVACVSGCDNAPGGGPLEAPVVVDEQHAARYPDWGYSNVSGAVRAELWRRHHFREDMPSSEDREWALHWLREGWVAVIDPDLRVEHEHHADPLRDVYRRYWNYWRGYTMYLDLPRYGARELAREWWSQRGGWPNHLRARLSPRRVVRLVGKYAGLAPTRRG